MFGVSFRPLRRVSHRDGLRAGHVRHGAGGARVEGVRAAPLLGAVAGDVRVGGGGIRGAPLLGAVGCGGGVVCEAAPLLKARLLVGRGLVGAPHEILELLRVRRERAPLRGYDAAGVRDAVSAVVGGHEHRREVLRGHAAVAPGLRVDVEFRAEGFIDEVSHRAAEWREQRRVAALASPAE